MLQAAGGALSVASSGSSQAGINLALVGLSLQVFTIVVFCGFFGDYLVRYFRSGVWREENGVDRRRLKLFFGFMFVAVVFTLVRCAYRLAELHEGYGGELVKDEPLFIALEGA